MCLSIAGNQFCSKSRSVGQSREVDVIHDYRRMVIGIESRSQKIAGLKICLSSVIKRAIVGRVASGGDAQLSIFLRTVNFVQVLVASGDVGVYRRQCAVG